MINAAADPNPTREFMFGDPFLKALIPSKSKSAKEVWDLILNQRIYVLGFDVKYKGQPM